MGGSVAGGSGRRDAASDLPVPGQELIDPLGGMIGQPRQDVGEPGLRIDAVELGRLDQGVDRRRPLPAAIGTGERPILPAEGNHGVILPMSGRRLSFTTPGIRCTGGASGGTTARIASPVASCTSRWR